MRDMFKAVDAVIRTHEDVGESDDLIHRQRRGPHLHSYWLGSGGGPSKRIAS